MRSITAEDIESIALGASVYGTGGGGDPYIGKLIAMNMMRRHGPVRLVELDALDDDALVVPVALVGAPTVAIEKFPSTPQFVGALAAIETYMGKRASAVMCAEAGGLNSTIPFAVASQAGLPLVDGDLMGRAFPEIQMTLATLHGIKATPMALCDDKGNSVVMQTVTNQYTERFVHLAVRHHLRVRTSALRRRYAPRCGHANDARHARVRIGAAALSSSLRLLAPVGRYLQSTIWQITGTLHPASGLLNARRDAPKVCLQARSDPSATWRQPLWTPERSHCDTPLLGNICRSAVPPPRSAGGKTGADAPRRIRREPLPRRQRVPSGSLDPERAHLRS